MTPELLEAIVAAVESARLSVREHKQRPTPLWNVVWGAA